MSGSTGLSPISAFLSYSANEAKFADASAAGNGQETALLTYFTKNAGNITSPTALLSDYKALSVVLGAFRIGNQIQSTALLKALLTQDPTSTSSVAYRSGNAKFLSFATALHSWSPPPFGTAAGVSAITTAYKTNQFESSADAQTPGVRQALYFSRTAGSITSLTQLQSDSDLLAVAVTGIGLPLNAFENLDFASQTSLLKQKLNIADFQKPSYVQHLSELFLVQQQLNGGSSSPAVQAGSVASLFSTSANPGGNGVLSILQSAQNGGTASTTLLSGSSSASSPLVSLFV